MPASASSRTGSRWRSISNPIDVGARRRHGPGEGAGAGADLDHQVARAHPSSGDDPGDQVRVRQEVLAEPLVRVMAVAGEEFDDLPPPLGAAHRPVAVVRGAPPKSRAAVALVSAATRSMSSPHTPASASPTRTSVGRLVGGGAVRRRGEVRSVGLHHGALRWSHRRPSPHRVPGVEGDRPGEGEGHPEVDEPSGPLRSAGPAVEHDRLAQPGPLHGGVHVGEGVAAVDDHRLGQLGGQCQLGGEGAALGVGIGQIAVEVEPAFAHGGGRGRQRPQASGRAVPGGGVVGMEAGRPPDAGRVLGGEPGAPPAKSPGRHRDRAPTRSLRRRPGRGGPKPARRRGRGGSGCLPKPLQSPSSSGSSRENNGTGSGSAWPTTGGGLDHSSAFTPSISRTAVDVAGRYGPNPTASPPMASRAVARMVGGPTRVGGAGRPGAHLVEVGVDFLRRKTTLPAPPPSAAFRCTLSIISAIRPRTAPAACAGENTSGRLRRALRGRVRGRRSGGGS